KATRGPGRPPLPGAAEDARAARIAASARGRRPPPAGRRPCGRGRAPWPGGAPGPRLRYDRAMARATTPSPIPTPAPTGGPVRATRPAPPLEVGRILGWTALPWLAHAVVFGSLLWVSNYFRGEARVTPLESIWFMLPASALWWLATPWIVALAR